MQYLFNLLNYQLQIKIRLSKFFKTTFIIISFQQLIFQIKFYYSEQMENTFVANRYRIGPKIGCGSFGDIYLCTEQSTSVVYACKREDDKLKHSQLITENKVMKIMGQYVGFPKLQWYGSQNKSNFVVMQMLGPSLQDLYGLCSKKFNLKTVLMLADQLIQKMQLLHSKQYIHRDIKPQNFLMGIGRNSHILHCIDFGLSKKYKDTKTQQHIPYKQNRSLTGTARYSSINTHLGLEQSRRDDLQSIGYVLVYFMQGSLPWQGIRANNKIQKYQKIMQKKMSIPVEVLCKGMPTQFSTYLNYCRSLKFEQKPDYLFLRRMFRDLFDRVGFQLDFQYSWSKLAQQTEFQTAKIQLQILKKGELIPLQQLLDQKQKDKMEFKDCLDQDDIEINMNGPQNLLEDALEESDMNLMKLQTNTNGGFIAKANHLLWE